MPPYSKCNIKNKKEERNFSSFLSDLDTLRNAKHINNIDTLRPMPAKVLTSYIATSARNAALTYIRNISRRKEILADEFDNSNVDDDHDSDPEVILLKSEEINSFAKIWDELDDKTKFLLSSRYILEKSYAEIASDLNVKPESARMALTRARRAALALSKKSHT